MTTGSLCTGAAHSASSTSGDPLCRLNSLGSRDWCFSIYSLMEEIEEDTLYFFTKSNLESKIDFRSEDVSKRNSHETKKKYNEEHTPERWIV